MSNHNKFAAKDFSAITLRRLAKAGITIVGATMLPDETGSFANGEVGYQIFDGFVSRILLFRQVLQLAK